MVALGLPEATIALSATSRLPPLVVTLVLTALTSGRTSVGPELGSGTGSGADPGTPTGGMAGTGTAGLDAPSSTQPVSASMAGAMVPML
jgi:hypothetical protein